MAQKRMFCTDIVESDAFIELPATSQTLYFHLGMRADDDGFVNPQITMRMVGSNKNDLDVLIVKRFVLPFKSGVVVIKHWRMNNFIRKDRYKPTNYLDEKVCLNIKENMAYTLDKSQGLPLDEVPWKNDEQMRLTSGQPLVNVGEDRIGEDRIGKIDTSLSFLKKLPEGICTELSEKYKIDPKGIKNKAYDLLLYCEQKGKRYKNYKAFLENAIRKDKEKLQNKFPYQIKQEVVTEEKLTPEQIARNDEMRKKIRQGLVKKI